MYELVCYPQGVVTCEVRREGKLISKTQGRNTLTPKLKEVLAMLLAGNNNNDPNNGGTLLDGDDAKAFALQVIFPDLNNANRYSSVGSTDNGVYSRTGTAPTAPTVGVAVHAVGGQASTKKLQYQQVFKDLRMNNDTDSLAFRLYGGRDIGTHNDANGAGTETQQIDTCNATATTGTEQANTRRYLDRELWGEKIDVAPGVQIVEGDSVTCTYEIYPAMTLGSVTRPIIDNLLCLALDAPGTASIAACKLTACGVSSASPPTLDTDLTVFAGTAKTGTTGSATAFGTADFDAAYIIETASPQGYTNLGWIPSGSGTNTSAAVNYSAANAVKVGDSAGIVKAGIQKSINSLSAEPAAGYCSVVNADEEFDNVVAYSDGALGYSPTNVNKRHSFQFRVRFN